MPTEFVVTVDRSPSPQAASALSATLTAYAAALLNGSRDSARFLWRSDSEWLAVEILRNEAIDERRGDRAVVRYATAELPAGITPREVDVLTLLAFGLTNPQISARLGTSPRTVSTQIERLLVRLGQSTRAGLGAMAVGGGLMRLPVPGGAEGLDGLGILDLERGIAGIRRRGALAVTYPGRAPFRIGTLVPGHVADADGIETRQGAELAVEEINMRGGVAGRRLELKVVEVDFLNEAESMSGLQRLFALDVDAITTSYTTVAHPAMLEAVAEWGGPLLHTATLDNHVGLVRDDPVRYGAVFQTCPSETHYGPAMLRWLAELEQQALWHPRDRRISVVRAQTSPLNVITGDFTREAERAGWTLEEMVVPFTLSDWTPVTRRLEATDPDVVVAVHILDTELTSFHRALMDSSVGAIPYYIYGPSIPRFGESLGAIADGVIWSTTTGTYDDVIGHAFRRRFHQRFRKLPGWSQASSSYDQVRLLAAAWAATDSREPRDVARYLREMPLRGVNGVYYFGSPGQESLAYPDTTSSPAAGQAHMIYQIQNGDHRVVTADGTGRIHGFRSPSWVPAESKTS